MTKYDLLNAIGDLDDAFLAQNEKPRSGVSVVFRNRVSMMAAIAAILAVVIFLHSGGIVPVVEASGLVAAPTYPAMAPYPESDYGTAEYKQWQNSLQQQYNQPEGYADVLNSYFKAAMSELLNATGDQNIVCSPLNIYMALSMLAEATDGNSRQQILNLLGTNSIDDLRIQAGHVWNAHFRNDGMATSVLANSLWLDEGIMYNPDTVNILANMYYASVYQGDLGSDEMNAALQEWLNEQTGGLLEEQAKGVKMSQGTILTLASTIYYKVGWFSTFDPEQNTEDVFYTPAGEELVSFMHQSDKGYYFWGEDYSAIRLPLKDDSDMWLILPDEDKSVADVLHRGEAVDMVLRGYSDWSKMERCKINLSLPKFDVTSDMDLVDSLKALGITNVFGLGADFAPILPETEAYVSAVKHAARVKIDEEGLEAAAYTVTIVDGTAIPVEPNQEIDFILDRPFIFVISSSDSLPLFAGVVNEP